MYRRDRISDHQQLARRGRCMQYAIKWRACHLAAKQRSNVQILRIGERADICALARVRPFGEYTRRKLIKGLVPRVRDEQLTCQARRRPVFVQCVRQAGQLRVFDVTDLCAWFDEVSVHLVHVRPALRIVEDLRVVVEAMARVLAKQVDDLACSVRCPNVLHASL
jgi:hypothetical protein